ncbi:MAG: IscS subfamily cysteine desulfurase [Gammaproteobacteria bacterium]
MATNVNTQSQRPVPELRRPVYFDYAATTPVDGRVAEKMMKCLTLDGAFANPASSSHIYGCEARELVEAARAQVAALVNCDPEQIIWTSGATESDNLAIKGVAHLKARQNLRHIVTAKTEHKAVVDTCKQLEAEGFAVTYLVPEQTGVITAEQVEAALKSNTSIVSIMHVNNETGAINDIEEIGNVCRKRGVTFHVDAAQSPARVPINLREWPVDLMSFSAHKVYGPKGVGALYISGTPHTLMQPLIHGGGHERGMRSGTLATHQAVGMGEAFELSRQLLESEHVQLQAYRAQFLNGLRPLGGVHLNGDPDCCVPGIVNVSFEGVEGESLLFALRDLAVSSGSACNSASSEASYVLRALGRSDQLAQGSVRFSFGRFTTEQHIDLAIELITREVTRLRSFGVSGV